jgi:ABC-type glycerol-3-phosphate transport system permease component
MEVTSSVSARRVSGKSAPSRLARLRRLSVSGWVTEITRYLVLLVLAAGFILPFYWMASSAVKDDNQVFTIPPVWIPNPAHWVNYPNAWKINNFNLYIFNTVVRYAIPATLGTLASSAFIAYGFARVRWPGRDFLFSICIATMMVPYLVVMVPLFITFKHLGWINTFLPLVVPAYFGNPFFVFMLRQFFLTIPQELSDAARIDGASELGILLRIILPLTKPALTVVALFSFLNAWNDYLGPLIYINQGNRYVLAQGIENLRQSIAQVGATALAYPYLMAVSTIVTSPIVIAFFFTQRTFIEGISLTGIKG